MLTTTVYLYTVDYVTVAHTMLAPINEQLINFVYSLLLLFIVMLQTKFAMCILCYS